MKRLSDWRPRLVAYMNTAARKPFRPGRHDCALFAAGAVEAMTGVDLARGWRGYSSLKSGAKKLAERGYDDHIALAEAHFDEVPTLFAQVGDIAVVDGDTEDAFGVVQGDQIYVLRRTGLGLMPLTAAKRVFRV